jgi:hypothetical protein
LSTSGGAPCKSSDAEPAVLSGDGGTDARACCPFSRGDAVDTDDAERTAFRALFCGSDAETLRDDASA